MNQRVYVENVDGTINLILMEAIKKFVNVLALLYLIGATLIFLDVLKVGQDTNPGFNTFLFTVGGAILLLELLVENLYIAGLKRGHVHTQHKINELKALLYDQKQEMQQYKSTRHDAAATLKSNDSTANPAAERGKIVITPSTNSNSYDPNRRRPDSSDSL